MSITPCTSSRRSVLCRLHVAHAGEIEQLLGDSFAAEGLGLNHPQVVADDVLVVARRRRCGRAVRWMRPSSDSAHMAIEASGLLISWATPAARKPTLANCSLRTTCLVRSCTCRSRSSRMAWKRAVMSFMAVGQLGHFVVRVEMDAIIEIAGGHSARAFDQHPQRPEDPAIEQVHEQAEHR